MERWVGCPPIGLGVKRAVGGYGVSIEQTNLRGCCTGASKKCCRILISCPLTVMRLLPAAMAVGTRDCLCPMEVVYAMLHPGDELHGKAI